VAGCRHGRKWRQKLYILARPKLTRVTVAVERLLAAVAAGKVTRGADLEMAHPTLPPPMLRRAAAQAVVAAARAAGAAGAEMARPEPPRRCTDGQQGKRSTPWGRRGERGLRRGPGALACRRRSAVGEQRWRVLPRDCSR